MEGWGTWGAGERRRQEGRLVLGRQRRKHHWKQLRRRASGVQGATANLASRACSQPGKAARPAQPKARPAPEAPTPAQAHLHLALANQLVGKREERVDALRAVLRPHKSRQRLRLEPHLHERAGRQVGKGRQARGRGGMGRGKGGG